MVGAAEIKFLKKQLVLSGPGAWALMGLQLSIDRRSRNLKHSHFFKDPGARALKKYNFLRTDGAEG